MVAIMVIVAVSYSGRSCGLESQLECEIWVRRFLCCLKPNNDITHVDITLYNSYSLLDWMLVKSGRVGVDTGGGTDFKVDPLPLGQLIVTLFLHHVIPVANSFCS